MVDKLVFFRTHYLGWIWLVGLFFGSILLINHFYQKHKFAKFEKEQQIREQRMLNSLKNKKSDNGVSSL